MKDLSRLLICNNGSLYHDCAVGENPQIVKTTLQLCFDTYKHILRCCLFSGAVRKDPTQTRQKTKKEALQKREEVH